MKSAECGGDAGIELPFRLRNQAAPLKIKGRPFQGRKGRHIPPEKSGGPIEVSMHTPGMSLAKTFRLRNQAAPLKSSLA